MRLWDPESIVGPHTKAGAVSMLLIGMAVVVWFVLGFFI